MQKNTKKNILLITTIYPAPDLKYGTSVCHYFTKEWVKMDYKVKVIHYQVVYPYVFYIFSKLFREFIASKTGAIVETHRQIADKCYKIDGVDISRFPIFKRIPMGKFSKRVLEKNLNKIIIKNEQEKFIPDYIIGHFSNPQLFIISTLKGKYPNSKTCMIMHDNGLSIKKIFSNNFSDLMENIDVWGFRSKPLKFDFEQNFGKVKNSFMCYSGIPKSYIINELPKDRFNNPLRKFLYVGDFIKRKFPEILPIAIKNAYDSIDFSITFIGSGAEKQNIYNAAEKLEIQNKIFFIGRIERDEIIDYFDNSDCFIMISKGEAFGLVYLEAMARGCITIGSKNEGIDGIIVNNVNGFLCEPGNDIELTEIIKKINNMTPIQRQKISQNAINTAREMTDYLVAKNYIQELESI
ncbi:MAG: glycosyltransferase [Paludibacter sp.]